MDNNLKKSIKYFISPLEKMKNKIIVYKLLKRKEKCY